MTTIPRAAVYHKVFVFEDQACYILGFTSTYFSFWWFSTKIITTADMNKVTVCGKQNFLSSSMRSTLIPFAFNYLSLPLIGYRLLLKMERSQVMLYLVHKKEGRCLLALEQRSIKV